MPCSLVIIAANSSFLLFNNSLNLNTICARFVKEVSRHIGNALAADSIASSIVAISAKSTSPVFKPVAGLKTSPFLAAVPDQLEPLIQ